MIPEHKETKKLGSYLWWVIQRWCMPLSFIAPALLSRNLLIGMLFVISLFALYWIPSYAHAYGHADEAGITFRRFFKNYRVTWDDVARVNWSNSNLLQRPYVYLTFDRRVGHFRTVKFACYRESSRLGQMQNPDRVPEILPWMMNQLRMNQPPTN